MEPTPPAGPDPDDPIARVVAEGPQRPRRRLPWLIAAAVGVLVIVGVGIAVLAGGDTSSDYGEQTRDDFLAACTAEGGEPVRPTCECIYDEIVATVPYDRFQEVDEQLAAQSGDLTLPDDIAAIVDGCVAAAAPTAS